MGNNNTTMCHDVRRDYKDTMFRMLFKDKKNLLSLYNAVNGTTYTNENDLEIVTLENAIYMNVKNDVAFVIDMRLHLYEHQSTISPNLPLRDLIYVAKELQTRVKPNEVYRSKLVKIPTPGFVVFYNGKKEFPKRKILRLSDAYDHPTSEPDLELKVTVLNINPGKNDALLDKCQTLKEYVQYVEKVRKYAGSLELPDAVERAVNECIREGILKDFLMRNRSEAIEVCIFEYNEEEALKYIRQDEREIGEEVGFQKGVQHGIQKGVQYGIQKAVIQMICKKLRRGKSTEMIADELEEDPEFIDRVCRIAEKYAPEYDCEQIYREFSGQEE